MGVRLHWRPAGNWKRLSASSTSGDWDTLKKVLGHEPNEVDQRDVVRLMA